MYYFKVSLINKNIMVNLDVFLKQGGCVLYTHSEVSWIANDTSRSNKYKDVPCISTKFHRDKKVLKEVSTIVYIYTQTRPQRERGVCVILQHKSELLLSEKFISTM